MPAILDTIAGGRRGRRNESDEFDSVYGDLQISAPLGVPFGTADLYVRDIGYEPDDEEQGYVGQRQGSDPMDYNSTGQSSKRGLNYPHERKSSLSTTASLYRSERTRERSRSQSGAVRESKQHSAHRTRSSSANRATRPQRNQQPTGIKSNRPAHEFDRSNLGGAKSFDVGVQKPAEDRFVYPSVNKGQMESSRNQAASERIPDQSTPRKGFQHSQNTMKATLDRSHSPAVTILSPVSETFVSEEAKDAGLDGRVTAAPVKPPSRLLSEKSELVTSPSTLSDTLSPFAAPTQSPHTKMLTFRHGEQFVNPLAAHATIQSRSHTPQHSLQPSEDLTNTAVPTQSIITNKPLPACPIGSSRSPPLECTAFMRSSGRLGPGLGSTAIMRPSSRNNQHRTYPQPQPVQARPHARSASLSHIMYSSDEPSTSLLSSNVRKGSYPTELEGVPARSEPSSAGSGFTSDAYSSRSESNAPTPRDPPDQTIHRRNQMSPAQNLSSNHKQFDHSADNQQLDRILPHATPSANPATLTAHGSSSGNIYNELRDDLAFVARDLNEVTLASQRDRSKKLSKLRIRARSSSRHDRRADRDHGGQHYTYREMDKSEFMGGWGNTAFVPAYDLPNSRSLGRDYEDLKGHAEVIVSEKKGVEIVPDYEDLWG